MSTQNKTIGVTDSYNCPACGKPLAMGKGGGKGSGYESRGVVLWCANGSCYSTACNDGAEGETLKEAHQKLFNEYEQEQFGGPQQP